MLIKGLIIPGHIFLSDKNPRVFWSHFREGFRQTAIYDQEWLIPIMTYLFTIIFSIIYHELFWFYLK